MPIWKQLLLNLYYHGSRPVRWWNLRCAVAEDRVPVAVLFYHRTARRRSNEWTITNRTFTRQIRWLKKHFEIVSLAEAQSRIRRGNRRPCVSITFDDGYADNCHHAIPLLVKERIPCTYFVTLGNVLSGEPFPHDVALGNPLLPNSLEELRAMAAAGIEIGAHTRTHPDLGKMTDSRQLHDEVVEAGRELADAVKQPVRYFAFPFGQLPNLNREVFRIAREAGYEGVCSAYGGVNLPGGDPFHVQRIGVEDGMIAMKNRTTGDPRRRHIPTFDYQSPESDTEKETTIGHFA